MSQPLPPVPGTKAPSVALGVWALVLSLIACCNFVGLVLAIIGICKYPAGSSGRVLCVLAVVTFVLYTAASMIWVPNAEFLQEYFPALQQTIKG
ncbi:MAG: hypothetical protein IKK45_05590 [Akkermansia sp.]|nr:hypothetical protein [Akkermansia sp.]